MTREELLYAVSEQYIISVKIKMLTEAYGLRNCADPMDVGDIADLYLKHKFLEHSNYPCDDMFIY